MYRMTASPLQTLYSLLKELPGISVHSLPDQDRTKSGQDGSFLLSIEDDIVGSFLALLFKANQFPEQLALSVQKEGFPSHPCWTTFLILWRPKQKSLPGIVDNFFYQWITGLDEVYLKRLAA